MSDTKPIFDNEYYCAQHPDVAVAVKRGQFKNGEDHYKKFGKNENRKFRFIETEKPINIIIEKAFSPKKNLKQSEKDIHDWIKELLKDIPNPVIFEIGANHGMDTVKLAAIKGAKVHAFEPEPRCDLSNMPKNVIVNKMAVCDKTGESDFNLSDSDGYVWTYSSSLLKPKTHLINYDYVKFNITVKVPTITIDEYCKRHKIKHIDFIFQDVQGAEKLVFIGGVNMLKNTRYVYTEYSDNEMYNGQPNLNELMEYLPNFTILDKWEIEPSNVLLKNNKL